MKRIIITILTLLMPLTIIAKEILVDKVVAVINEEIKTMSDLKKYKKAIEARKVKMDPQEYSDVISSDKKLLDYFVQETLLLQYAKEQGLEPSKEELDEFIKRRMSDLGMNQKDLEKQLEASGQTIEGFKQELKVEQAKARIFEKDLKRKISVSDSDYEIFFKKEFNQDINIIEYHLQHIILKTSEQADVIYKKIKSGEDFSAMAKQYSDDKATNNNDGDLGFIQSTDLFPELLKAVNNMSPGDIKGPIKTKLGYQIIKLSETRNIKNPEYVRNKEDIERTIIERQFRHQLKLFVEDLKEDAYVKTYI